LASVHLILDDPKQRSDFRDAFARAGGWPTAGPHAQGENLDEVLSSLDDERFPGAVLPRVELEGQVLWYAVAMSGAQWRELMPLLKAFVGVTASDFRGTTTPLQATDSFERWLSAQGFGAVARFSAGPDPVRQRLTLAGLQRLREMLDRSDAPRRELPHSTLQVLRDFHLALSGLDRSQSERAVAFLRENMRLDALNLRALEVQMDATFEQWEAIYTHPSFSTLVQTRRSTRLTGALIEAAYHTELDGYQATLDVDGAFTCFRERVLPLAGTLFRIPPSLPRSAVATACMLAALTRDPPDWDTASAISSSALQGTDSDVAMREALLERRPNVQVHPNRSVPAFEDFQAQLAVAEDSSLPATSTRALAVLVAASEIDTLAAYQTAVRYVERLPETERRGFLERRGVHALWGLASVHRPGELSVPQNWMEWLAVLPSMDFAQARLLADSAVQQWPIREHLPSAAAVQELADGLLEAPGDLVAEAVPYLLGWLRTDEEWPNPAHLPVLEALFTLLVIGARRTPAALAALTQVVDAELLIGLLPNTYQLALADIGELVPQALSIRTVDWLLDLLEVVLTQPTADSLARERFWDIALGALQPLVSRLAPRQREVLTDLGHVLNRNVGAFLGPAPVAADADVSVSGVLADKLVAVYTLNESVGHRVKQALQAESPRVRVESLDDHVSSPRLVDLARSADLFVVCWQSAKHAATEAIKRARPSTRPTIYPTGKGSSSIADEVCEFALRAFRTTP
jgi:hypothetical protein